MWIESSLHCITCIGSEQQLTHINDTSVSNQYGYLFHHARFNMFCLYITITIIIMFRSSPLCGKMTDSHTCVFFFNLEVNIHHHRHVLFLRRSLPLPVAERLYRPLPKSYTARCRTPRCGQLPNSRYRLGVRFPNHCSASEMFCWHDRFTPLQRRQKVFSCILNRSELVFLSLEILKKLVLSVICVLQTVFQINHWVSITHFHTSNQYKPLFFSHC